ncbi:FMN-dependent NADH-azoreductase [Ferrimonas kyonanensis]|uniref:FMN-dependent NADH-azoreductase n=1 Tax=Ferrimonas kyonanensis TaxID=364763 RepID=UPI0004167925|nr:NAD(P)H-dependent oxidoreductase [Ferrimonas kyonanensis]
MTNLLLLHSSAREQESQSRSLCRELVASLSQTQSITLTERDLAADPLPHFSGHTLEAFYGEQSSPEIDAADRLSNRLIDELKAADVVVIGAPVYNSALPSTLKSWLDHVMRPRRTFRYHDGGIQGMLSGKRAYLVLACGGSDTGGAELQLRGPLAQMGITDLTVIHANQLDTYLRQQALARIRTRLHSVA